MIGGLCELLEAHDTNQQKLYKILEKLVAEQRLDSDEAISGVNYQASTTATSWRNILTRCAEDYGIESQEFVDSVSTLWRSDEEERAKFLKSLSPGANIIPAGEGKAEVMKNIVEQFTALKNSDEITDESVIGAMVQQYVEYIENDIETFAGSLHAAALTNEQPVGESAPARFVLRKVVARLGRQAGVAMTIAAGVAGGIIIGSRFSKK